MLCVFVALTNFGLASIRAQEVSAGDAALAVWKEQLSSAVTGRSVLSRGDRTEYQRGSVQLIVAAPHGGRLNPDDVPNRTEGVLSSDTNVDRLARAVCQKISEQLAIEPFKLASRPDLTDKVQQPHLVLCHLVRRKLDANRPLEAACASDSAAKLNWHEYQLAIQHAKQLITNEQQRGLFVEIHGHAHPTERLELGYLLRSKDFELPSKSFNELESKSSLREIAARGQIDSEQLIRGSASLGHFLSQQNLQSVPSPEHPSPGRDPYFNGGWNTLQHGSRDQGTISSLQIECHYRGVRDSKQSIESAAAGISRALISFLKLHYANAN